MNPEITAGQGFTPVNQRAVVPRKPSSGSGRLGRSTRPASITSAARVSRPASSEWDREPEPAQTARSTPPVDPAPIDLFAAAGGGSVSGSDPTPSEPASNNSPASKQPITRDGGSGTLLVASPRFKLQYAVDDGGPNGPAKVELWITPDGGRTWIRREEDQDRVSPIEVDLGGEGTYGLCLVARSASGLGDQPPAPGDPPQSWVEVDSTPPAVQLQPPQVGSGANSGKVAFAWRASDLHLPPKSVSLAWRNDEPGAQWQTIVDGRENAGQFVWTVPATVPQRFHVKVEAVDTLGHHGSAETTETAPIMVDRSRPRSRIIGLDADGRAGSGSSAQPMR